MVKYSYALGFSLVAFMSWASILYELETRGSRIRVLRFGQ